MIAGEDEQALADTFAGETTLDAEIRAAVLTIEEDEIFINGIKARETELKARRSRLEKRVEATRGLIEQAMTVANWPRLEMDIGTVSVGKAAPRIEIDNESEVPTQFWKRQDPVLDKAGLGKTLRERQKALDAIAKLKTAEERAAALAALETEMPAIPGCHLETAGVSLTIRRG
ncbi:siphovirus Gp157 family protein [Bradyrhizobium sp. 930_D9_N1_4]|uniref:siphovirus Gp157 family protein n=1 Tax=Bradyrhizobium sp. 930_D9_N1_4 TaxID=3240374 RepID=UPI003F88AAF2